jgi:hypothetical protein
MADLTVTGLGLGADAVVNTKVQFGAAANPGDAVYLDVSDDNKWKLALNSGTEIQAGKDGVGLCATLVESDARYGSVVRSGEVFLVATTAQGVTYVVASTPGNIGLDSEHATSGDWKTILGVGSANATGTHDSFILNPQISGEQIA